MMVIIAVKINLLFLACFLNENLSEILYVHSFVQSIDYDFNFYSHVFHVQELLLFIATF